jgi:L-cysteine desulfidase
MEQDGKILHSAESLPEANVQEEESFMNVADIITFADTVPLENVREIIERQINYNSAISQEGLKNNYGANIGQTLLKMHGTDIKIRAKAAAAAGSDARMSGCELPVIITAGSGNQGITASLPVIEYAKELGCTQEQLIRALLVSDLITLHVKTGIGRLSAYCGAVCAGCAAGAAITYLMGGRLEEVSHTLVNSLAIVSGIICDGAKPSCAAKIAMAVEAGLIGHYMYENGQQFYAGEGIVSKGVEKTINSVGRLGRDGMSETDKEIIRIMLEKL